MAFVRPLIEDTDAGDQHIRLLRVPAAIVAAAYVTGLLFGALARPSLAAPPAGIVFVLTAFVCGPFLLPARWFGAHRAVLLVWMLAAAVMATTRAIVMAAWLLPRLPLDAWLTKAVVDLVVSALLWLAAMGVWRTSRAAVRIRTRPASQSNSGPVPG